MKDVHDAIITTVEQESPFAFFTPYELFLRFLAEYFRDYLGDRSRLNAENLPQNFKGTHMSRFVEILHSTSEVSLESFPALLDTVVRRLESSDAYIEAMTAKAG